MVPTTDSRYTCVASNEKRVLSSIQVEMFLGKASRPYDSTGLTPDISWALTNLPMASE